MIKNVPVTTIPLDNMIQCVYLFLRGQCAIRGNMVAISSLMNNHIEAPSLEYLCVYAYVCVCIRRYTCEGVLLFSTVS